MTGIPLNGRVKNYAKGEFSTSVGKKNSVKKAISCTLVGTSN
jgi:hypothetical protein